MAIPKTFKAKWQGIFGELEGLKTTLGLLETTLVRLREAEEKNDEVGIQQQKLAVVVNAVVLEGNIHKIKSDIDIEPVREAA